MQMVGNTDSINMPLTTTARPPKRNMFSKYKKSIITCATMLAMTDLLLSDLSFSKSHLRHLLTQDYFGFSNDHEMSEEMMYVMEEEIFDSHEEANHNHAIRINGEMEGGGGGVVADHWGQGGEEEYYDHEAINQRALHRLRLLQDPSININTDLRYMIFGHPTAMIRYGVYNNYYTYAALLSHYNGRAGPVTYRVKRIGDSLSGPRYPSACTQSMVEKEIGLHGNYHFDVIVLDYFSKAIDGLYELTQRLRQRYPDAIIIVLRIWKPVHINWMVNGHRNGTIKDWADTLSEQYNRTIRFGTDEFFEHLNNTDVTMEWQDFTERDRVLGRVVLDFGAKVYHLDMDEDPKVALWHHHEMYYPDYTHISVLGHRHLYFAIMHFVREGMESYPTQPREGTWGEGDSCSSWYMSGELPEGSQHSPNLVMEEFQLSRVLSSHVVHAASTGIDHPNAFAWINVNNPFVGPRNLILSYMATGPAPAKYPVAEVTVHGPGDVLIANVTLDPLSTMYGRTLVHTIKTTKVAVIPHGNSRVSWRRLETVLPPARPFRVTAVQVVGTDVEETGVLGPVAYFTSLGQFDVGE